MQIQENPAFLRHIQNMYDITGRRIFQPWLQPRFLFWLSKYFNIFHKYLHAIDMFIENVNCLSFSPIFDYSVFHN